MPLCKDCTHNEVCTALYELNGIPKVGGSSHCGYFRNKALNVKFPFKPGDTVYTKRINGEIIEGYVESIHQNSLGREPMRWIATIWFEEYYGKTAEIGDVASMRFYMPIEAFDLPIDERCHAVAVTKEELK